jgi:AcrR family transcriptional regulator
VALPSAPLEPASADLTARARIRDAAIILFAERGVEAASVRDIARTAGVSGGLVRHHFGSKDDLRSACDSYALSRMMKIKEQAVLEGQISSPGFMASAQPAMLLLLKYFARCMIDGSPAATAMFDEMVAMTEDWLAEHAGQLEDPHAFAALLVAMELGALVMQQQLSRVLETDAYGPEGHLRLLRAKVDFYSQLLLAPGLANQAPAAIARLQQTRKAPR